MCQMILKAKELNTQNCTVQKKTITLLIICKSSPQHMYIVILMLRRYNIFLFNIKKNKL